VARRKRVGFSQEPVNPSTFNQGNRGLVAVVVCEEDGGIGDAVDPGNPNVDVNQAHPFEIVELPHREPPHVYSMRLVTMRLATSRSSARLFTSSRCASRRVDL